MFLKAFDIWIIYGVGIVLNNVHGTFILALGVLLECRDGSIREHSLLLQTVNMQHRAS